MNKHIITTRSTHTKLIVTVAVFAAVITGMAVWIGLVKADLSSAEASLTKVISEKNQAKAAQADAETELSTTVDRLESAETTLRDHEEQLDACAQVVEISDHQYETGVLLNDAVLDALNERYVSGSENLGQAQDHLKEITQILTDAGFSEDLIGLWEECAPAHEAL